MDKLTLDQEESKASSTFSSRLSRTLNFRSQKTSRTDSETAEEIRGQYGLVLLSSPSEPIVDFIFVHGLRGGSRKTWSKSENPLHFWPKEWLPRDPDFKHVRIHSFGYNSDWSEINDNFLNVHDFGQSLLGALHDSPLIRRDATLPIVMIGHSMGGLVIKKAYILAKRDPTYRSISDRFHTVFFIATPHRGADSAQLLANLLRVTPLGNHSYLVDLRKRSSSIESINDDFRHIHDQLSLYSFYETIPTNLGIRSSLIVEKDSAILGYAGERRAYINANHRGACKFDTPENPNYLILRNAFVHTIDGVFENWSRSRTEMQREQKQRLQSFLGVQQTPEDQYLHYSDLKVRDSCDWLLEKQSFQDWRDIGSSNIYWLSANPASGKSVMAAHVVDHLEEANLTCSYFFFTQESKVDSKLSYFLRSIAYQMALSNVYIRDALLAMIDDGPHLAKADFRAVWRKVFVGGIFRTRIFQPYFWVLDGMDECDDRHELIKKLGEIEHEYPLRIFVTSRPSALPPQHFGAESLRIHVEQVSQEQTAKGIRALIEANMHQFPAKDDAASPQLIQQIVEKADGCFLWVKLVLDELREVYSPRDIKRILDGVPPGMDALYSRIVKNLENAKYGKEVAKAILTWTVVSARPLTVEELGAALKLDLQDTIHDLAGKAAVICGHLVYVDSKSQVRMVHQTAREFLLQPDLQSEFALDRGTCHSRLAKICLGYLLGDEMKAPRGRRSSAARLSLKPSSLLDYACSSFSEHVRGTSSADGHVFALIHEFLTSSNVLRWIEHIAQSGDLESLVRTARVVSDFIRRRTSKIPPSDAEQNQFVGAWSVDLVRLASKFGQQLTMAPWSIYNLVPPFCPPASAIYKQFGTFTHSITVEGLSAQSWDDRISCYVATGEQASSAAYTDGHYAVGYSSGLIILFHAASCQVMKRLHHGEQVKSLQFSHSGKMLASGAMTSVQLFNVLTGDRILHLDTGHQCLALHFDSRDQSLSAALRNSEKMTWELRTGSLMSGTRLMGDQPSATGQHSMAARAPQAAAFSPELNLLAVIFRAPAIMIWDLQDDHFLKYCDRCPDSEPVKKVRQAPALNAVFCSDPAKNLLAATYFDGELILFNPDDPKDNTIVASTMAGGEVLACSPDGKIVATGDSGGNVQLFEFETLKLLYRINSWDDSIRSLAFSEDGRRFIDIRGSTCNVWEPSELIRQEPADQNSDSDARSSTVKEIDHVDDADLVMITACAVHPRGLFVICGKDDGSVCLYDARSGLQTHVLYNHGQGAAITRLTYDVKSGFIASADDSSTVLVHKMINETIPAKGAGDWMRRIKFDGSINQLLIGSQRLFIIAPSTISLYNLDGTQHIKSFSRRPRHASSDDQEIQQRPPGVQDTGEPWKWLIVEGEPILFDLDAAASFSIHSLESSTDSTLSSRSGTHPLWSLAVKERSNPDELFLCFNNEYLAMSSRSSDPLEPPIFSIRPSPHLQAKDIIPIRESAAINRLSGYLARILGSFGSKMVFIDRHNWVSSIELAADHYERHFCVPSDWLSMDELLVELTQTMVIFVRRNEIAVVRNAFWVAFTCTCIDNAI